MILGLALALCVSAAPPTAPPTTWTALKAALPKEPRKRVPLLLRFARDETVRLEERRRAAKEARTTATDGKRVDAALLEAHLAAVAGKLAQRREALGSARAAAKKLGLAKETRRVDDALTAEASLAKLGAALTAREKLVAKTTPRPATAAEQQLATDVENALPTWLALSDERQHAVARVALARVALLDGDPPAAERALSDVIDALGNGVDGAAVRADAWRRLSRVFETSGRLEEAAAAALAADRATAGDPARPRVTRSGNGAASPANAASYARTAETAALCKDVRASSVSCAKIEVARWGARSYFDFSTEKRATFDTQRADDVLAEYESTLHECLKQGVKLNLTTNSHVELVWSVTNEGRVQREFDLAPKRLKGTAVETCFADAFALWRYPRYPGEMQHVRLSFDVGE